MIGIDLGTTNSVVAFFENNKFEVISNSEGKKITPSVVFYNNTEIIVGELAKRYALANPSHTISSIKQLMGVSYTEYKQLDFKVNYEITSDENDKILIKIEDNFISPEEISAEVIKKMKSTAEDYFGEEITEAVITVPAYFNDSQRQATIRAAELANLKVNRIINEPTAAALAYGLSKDSSEKIAIFDFGGGTFDISILELDEDVYEVKSTNGDTHLGGNDLDNILADWITNSIKEELDFDPAGNIEILQRIKETAEKIKCELSTLNSTLISLPYLYSDQTGVKHFEKNINREEFANLIEPIISKLIPPCRKALLDAGYTPDDINNVILVGGSTRIPVVQELVKSFFKKEPLKTVNPDEAVALGACIQSGIIHGSLREVLLLDITPLSLGIELQGGVFSTLIPRNSSIPTTATKNFTTVVDNQSTVKIHILQGERKIAHENHSLGYFKLEGIPSAPREVPEIEVKFYIDANGILNVSATDLVSGLQKEITIEAYKSETTKDFSKDVVDAQGKTKEDYEYLRKVEVKNSVQVLRNITENYINEKSDEFTEEDLELAEQTFIKLDFALAKDDMERIEEIQKTLFLIGNNNPNLYLLQMLNKK